MKIIFFGTSEFAIPALRALISSIITPIAVITTPDQPKGRGKKLSYSPIKTWIQIEKSELSILQPTIIDTQLIYQIENLKPDIGVVVSYGKILPKLLIELFPKGVLNIHPSLLPKYRGSSPIQTSIFNGDKETGVTIMLIDDQMDHGPIVAQQKYNMHTQQTNYQELHNALAGLGAQMFVEILPKWIAGEIKPISQDDTRATYTKLLKKEYGKIDWSKSAKEIERMVRAYNPWPGAYIQIQNSKSNTQNILKIIKAEVIISPISSLGIFFKTSDGFPAVTCGKDALKFLVVQPEGKKEMSGKAYLLGHNLQLYRQ